MLEVREIGMDVILFDLYLKLLHVIHELSHLFERRQLLLLHVQDQMTQFLVAILPNREQSLLVMQIHKKNRGLLDKDLCSVFCK